MPQSFKFVLALSLILPVSTLGLSFTPFTDDSAHARHHDSNGGSGAGRSNSSHGGSNSSSAGGGGSSSSGSGDSTSRSTGSSQSASPDEANGLPDGKRRRSWLQRLFRRDKGVSGASLGSGR